MQTLQKYFQKEQTSSKLCPLTSYSDMHVNDNQLLMPLSIYTYFTSYKKYASFSYRSYERLSLILRNVQHIQKCYIINVKLQG